MPHDVFISYSSKDKAVADAVLVSLEGSGIRCWMAPRDIAPGADWGAAIVDAIAGCEVMVLVYSSVSNESQQVKREVERAVFHDKVLVPLRIEAAPLSKSLEYFISTPHWLDAMQPPLQGHLQRLIDAVRPLVRRPDRKMPVPQPVAPRVGTSKVASVASVGARSIATGAPGIVRVVTPGVPVARGVAPDVAGACNAEAKPRSDGRRWVLWMVLLAAALGAGVWPAYQWGLRTGLFGGGALTSSASHSRLTTGEMVRRAYFASTGSGKQGRYDPQQAVFLWRQAAAAGDGRAMNGLGRMYQRGQGGLPHDDAAAIAWFQKGADAGDGLCLYDLGRAYFMGRGVPKTSTKANDYIRRSQDPCRKAADAGEPLAMTYLGIMYFNGGGGLERDEAEAVGWFRKAVAQGEPHAMAFLGEATRTGRGGLTASDAEAVALFRKASDVGDPLGLHNLGFMYAEGHGVPRDFKQATTLMKQSADAGNPEAKKWLSDHGS